MVGSEAALEMRVLHRHGKSIREIAREMGVSATRCGDICGTRRRSATSPGWRGRPSSTRSRTTSSPDWRRRCRSVYRAACC